MTVASSDRLVLSESLGDLNSVRRSKSGISWKVESPFMCTPPGTPPPPYHGENPHQKENSTPPPVPPPPDDVRDGHRDEDVRIYYQLARFTRLRPPYHLARSITLLTIDYYV